MTRKHRPVIPSRKKPVTTLNGNIEANRNPGVRLYGNGNMSQMAVKHVSGDRVRHQARASRRRARTSSTVISCRQTLSSQGVLRWLAALTQGEQARPA